MVDEARPKVNTGERAYSSVYKTDSPPKDRPNDRVLFQEKGHDMVAVIIAFDKKVEDYHWAGFHRDLQKTFKANFPRFHRKEINFKNEKFCYSFLGFKHPQG